MRSLGPLALAVAVVLGPQFLGGVVPWTIPTLASLAAAALVATAWSMRNGSVPVPSGPLAWGFGLALVATLLQAIPLPCGLVAQLLPVSAGHQRALAHVWPELRTTCSLSLDPGATRTELVKLAACLAVAWAAYAQAAHEGRRTILRMVAASGALMAVVALAHGVLELDSVFGAYKPRYVERRLLLAPVMNENQLGGFLSLTFLPAAILMLTTHRPGERWAWRTVTLVVVVAGMLTLSRGAFLSFGLGVLALGFVVLRPSANAERGALLSVRQSAMLAVPIVLGLVAAWAWAGVDVQSEAEKTDLSKLALARNGLQLALSHPFTGVGRGAFAAAFAPEGGAIKRAMVPENIVAQWTSEWGLVVGGVLLLALVVGLIRRIGPGFGSTQRIAALALSVTLLHDLFDFTLELLGPALVASALLGAALAPSRRHRAASTPRAVPRGVPALLFHPVPALCLAIVVALAPGTVSREVRTLSERLEAALKKGDHTAFAATLERAVVLHPAEPLFALLASVEARTRRDPSTVRWLNRTMTLAPAWGAPHTEAAKALADAGLRPRALTELREAFVRDPVHTPAVMCPLLGAKATWADIEWMMPTTQDQASFLQAIARCDELPLDVRAAADERILSLEDAEAEQRDAILRIAERDVSTAGLERTKTLLRNLHQSRRADAEVAAAYARRLLAEDDARGALEVVDRTLRHAPEAEALLRAKARAALLAEGPVAMRAAIAELRGASAADPAALARTLELLAELEEKGGHPHLAVVALDEAFGYQPSARLLVRLARVSEHAGLVNRAIEAHRTLCRGGVDGEPRPKHCGEITRLEKAAALPAAAP